VSFQQLFYTSCEQGLSAYAGYQFNAVTDGTSGETMRTVETLTAYEPPHSCAYADTAEELDGCPVNLCFAPGKIAIVANVRYVGRDSSQRFGNYFAHALATGDLDLEDASLLPIELWRADWWNCRPAAATSLPTLDGPLGTGPLSRNRAAEFLGSHPHRGRLPALLSAAGLARSRADRSVLVVAESADDVANWFAAVSYLLPPRWVRGLSFSTYLNRPSRSRLHLLGTLPETDLDLGPDADEKFYLFDFQAGRFADVDEHPLTSLCVGIGVTELPALWAWADRLASGSESTLDDWYPVVAAAAALGRVLLTETDLGSVIGWLNAAGTLPDETQTAVARVVHSHPAITSEHRQVLLAVGERTGDAGLWEQVQYGLLEPLLLARTDGQAVADALAPSTVTAVPGQSPARVREQLTAKAEEQFRLAEDPRDTLALLDWAGLAGLPAAPDVLAECGRRMVAPLLATDRAGPLPPQQRDQAGRVTKRWPAVREGIVRYLTALASSRPADVAAIMAGITGELLTWQDIPDDSPIRVPYLVHQGLRRREPAAVILGRLAELGLIMDVDDLLLSMLWPKGIWTLAEAAQVLAKVDPRVLTGTLGWFDATLATTPPQPDRDDYGTLCTALMTSPLAAAPAVAKMPVLHEVAYLYRVWSAAQRLRDLLPAIEAARGRESAPALVLSRQWLAPRVAVLPADTPSDIISALRQLHPAAVRRYLVVARDRFRAPVANTPMHAAALWYLSGTEWASQYGERIEELFNYVARGWPQEYLVQTARQLAALDPAASDDFSDWIGVRRSGRFAKIPRALRATGRRLGRIMSGGPPPASPGGTTGPPR
jgi:GTPase-associated protein 1, N-terminal domain type 2/GTPase-associated protein 1, middle domain